VPNAALAAAIRRTRPTTVVVWSHTADTGDPHHLELGVQQRVRPMLVAAGPGWRDLPAEIERPATLAATLALVLPVAGN
jgi:MerR family transcriptional regulator, light-induced transcriptional regulator